MLRIPETALSKRLSLWCLPFLFASLTANAAPAEQTPTTALVAAKPGGSMKPVSYHVINLGTGYLTEKPVINANGQVAFSMDFGTGISHAFVYDGNEVKEISPGFSFAIGIDNLGQVVGYSFDASFSQLRGYVWSKDTGAVELATLPGAQYVTPLAINNRGQVTGSSAFPVPSGGYRNHVVLWDLTTGGVQDLGTLGGRFANGTLINDKGMIAGWSEAPTLDSLHAFAWTPAAGMTDLGTLGLDWSFPFGIGSKGEVAGTASTSSGIRHAFVWTRKGGMVDIGAEHPGAITGSAAMSPEGKHVAGIVELMGTQHAMIWTRGVGMLDLGTLGGQLSAALSVNNKGQVVGGANTASGQAHAFIWTAASGMVDLNERMLNAPPGLELEGAIAISENGSIIANSNGGLILLKPDHADDDDDDEDAAAIHE